MKKSIVLLVLLVIVGCDFQKEAQTIDVSKLKKVDGKYYLIDDLKGYTGIVEEYSQEYPDILSGKVEMKDGVLDGKVETYYLSGKLQFSQGYKEGILDGKTIGYFESGNPSYEREFLMGKTHGIYRIYHENGKIKHEDNYIDNKLNGESFSYNEDGEIEEKRVYEDGILVERNDYTKTEEKVSYIFTIDGEQTRSFKEVKK